MNWTKLNNGIDMSMVGNGKNNVRIILRWHI